MNALIETSAAATMTSREIADLTGKRHDHVLRDARAMLSELYGNEEVSAGLPDKDMFEVFCDRMGWGMSSPKLGNQRIQGVTVSRDSRGFVSEIGLDYNHSMTLVSGYSAKLRKTIVDRWQSLERATDPATVLENPAAMRGLLLTYTEKVLLLESEKAAMVDKVEALDRISTADGTMAITNAAKSLQVRPKDLFDLLSKNHWIYRRQGDAGWIAYQDKLQAGVLAHKVTTVTRDDGSEKVVAQVRITAPGLTKLAAMLH